MVTIKLMKLRIQELYKELADLEKAGYTEENLERVRNIKKQADGIRMAIRHTQQKLGLHTT